jgi:hypothetical protein
VPPVKGVGAAEARLPPLAVPAVLLDWIPVRGTRGLPG